MTSQHTSMCKHHTCNVLSTPDGARAHQLLPIHTLAMPHDMPCTSWTKPNDVPVNVALNTDIETTPLPYYSVPTPHSMACHAMLKL